MNLIRRFAGRQLSLPASLRIGRGPSGSRSRQALNRLTAHPVIFSIVAQHFVAPTSELNFIAFLMQISSRLQAADKALLLDMCPRRAKGRIHTTFHFGLILPYIPKFYQIKIFITKFKIFLRDVVV